MNKVILNGRLTKEPELREAGKDSAVLRFTLAIADGVYQGEKRTQFITCVAWNTLAETISKYVKKGDMLSVAGKLQENNYEKDGVMHYQTEVFVTEAEFLPNARAEEKPAAAKVNKYNRRG